MVSTFSLSRSRFSTRFNSLPTGRLSWRRHGVVPEHGMGALGRGTGTHRGLPLDSPLVCIRRAHVCGPKGATQWGLTGPGITYVAAARAGKGATVEYNLRAQEDSEKQVKRFLETQLGP